jgi:hypothetical protein
MFIAIRGELIIIIIIIKPLLMYLTEIAVTQYIQYIQYIHNHRVEFKSIIFYTPSGVFVIN